MLRIWCRRCSSVKGRHGWVYTSRVFEPGVTVRPTVCPLCREDMATYPAPKRKRPLLPEDAFEGFRN
jgi:hypothetical protein